jgi:hypothetical protein
VADDMWQRGLYLPSSHTLGSAEIETVIDAVREARA